jgi:hypothetical protein
MKPEDFRQRFIAALPPTPPALDLELDDFIQFAPSQLTRYELDSIEHHLPSGVGFPAQAAPYLSFGAWRGRSDWVPQDFFPFGSDGGEGIICIGIASHNIVLVDNDCISARPTYVNASLITFAECLCIYAEHWTRRRMEGCFQQMCGVDASLSELGQWWLTQTQQSRVQ